MPGMHANVLVSVDLIALAHDEAAERPVALTDRELPAPGIFEFFEASDRDFPLA
jgi:hypothetical protein